MVVYIEENKVANKEITYNPGHKGHADEEIHPHVNEEKYIARIIEHYSPITWSDLLNIRPFYWGQL